MKVLFLTNVPSPYRVDFFSSLGKLCDLTVVYERSSSKERDIKWKREKGNTYKEIYLHGINVGVDNSLSFEIIKILKKIDFDLCIIGMYSTYTAMIAMEYLKWKNIPFFISTDGGFIAHENIIKYKIKKRYISAANGWLSPGKKATEYLEYYGAQKNRIFSYPFTSLSSSDLKKRKSSVFNKRKLKKELNIKESKIILSVGRFTYDRGYGKGFDVLLKVAENLPTEYGIYIVGDTPTEEFLEMKRKKSLNNVHFIGFKEKKELDKYYEIADVFILLTRKDVWGLVINEAMSYGLPVITTYSCLAGVELIEPNINGYLVEADDVKGILAYIDELFSSTEKRLFIGKNNDSKIKKYTIENMAKVHFDIFKKILDERND